MPSPSPAPPRPTLPLEIQRLIDARCEQFEAAWRAGQQPTIEEYLPRTTDLWRQPLLCELVWLDLAFRRKAGQNIRLESYLARFPEIADLLTAAPVPPPKIVEPLPTANANSAAANSASV